MSEPIKAEVRRSLGGSWAVYVGDMAFVTRESYQVASHVAYHLEHPEAWDESESAEVAESIRKSIEGAGGMTAKVE